MAGTVQFLRLKIKVRTPPFFSCLAVSPGPSARSRASRGMTQASSCLPRHAHFHWQAEPRALPPPLLPRRTWRCQSLGKTPPEASAPFPSLCPRACAPPALARQELPKPSGPGIHQNHPKRHSVGATLGSGSVYKVLSLQLPIEGISEVPILQMEKLRLRVVGLRVRQWQGLAQDFRGPSAPSVGPICPAPAAPRALRGWQLRLSGPPLSLGAKATQNSHQPFSK